MIVLVILSFASKNANVSFPYFFLTIVLKRSFTLGLYVLAPSLQLLYPFPVFVINIHHFLISYLNFTFCDYERDLRERKMLLSSNEPARLVRVAHV